MKVQIVIEDVDASEALDILQRINNTAYIPPAAYVPQPFVAATPQNSDMNAAPVIAPKINPGEGVDADGIPWNEEIHASTKLKTEKGYWKRRRGVQPVEYDRKVQELRAMMQSGGVATAPAAPPVYVPPAPPVAPMAPTAPAMPAAPQAYAPPVAPAAPPVYVPPAPPVAPMAPSARNFQGLMLQISKLFETQRIQPDYPPTIVARINHAFATSVNAISDIVADENMVAYAWSCLDADNLSN